MMPVNSPFTPGNIAGGDPQLIVGGWVIGFYMDAQKQKPLIMGSIGQVPGSTSTFKNCFPIAPKAITLPPSYLGIYQLH